MGINTKQSPGTSVIRIIFFQSNRFLYQIGLIAKRDMELAPSISSGFEMALLRMVAFLPGEVPKTKKKIESIKSTKIPETKEVEEKTLKEAGLTEKNQESLDISAKSWNAIFNKLKLDAGTKQLVSHCSFLRTDDSIVYLSMPEEKLNVFNGKHRQELQDCLTKHFNQPCNVFLEAGEISEESPNKIKEKDKRKIQDQAEKAIKEDPKVQNIIETFGAKVVESSIEPRNS